MVPTGRWYLQAGAHLVAASDAAGALGFAATRDLHVEPW